jgi:hypothetical protein
MRFITLITDFGSKGPYVGAMKGVIYTINPDVGIVDITHEVPPQNIKATAYLVKSCWRYYPSGTVHLVVVDPGVGSERRGILLEGEDCWFIGPDNGIFSYVIEEAKVTNIYLISNPKLSLREISSTFHGRDIFAPCAAHLTMGVRPEEFGPKVHDPVILDLRPKIEEGLILGEVIYIDNFGNIVSNITRESIPSQASVRVEIGDCCIDGISRFYSQVKGGEFVALFGSSGHLEVSVNLGDAAKVLGVKEGEKVIVRMRDE